MARRDMTKEEAEELLRQKPELLPSFERKYGYRPTWIQGETAPSRPSLGEVALSDFKSAAEGLAGGAAELYSEMPRLARGALDSAVPSLTDLERETGQKFLDFNMPGAEGARRFAEDVARKQAVESEFGDAADLARAERMPRIEKATGALFEDKKFGPILDVMSDPENWVSAASQAAPSLAAMWGSRRLLGPQGAFGTVAGLEGGGIAQDIADYERSTGKTVSPEDYLQEVATGAAINAALEKAGFEEIVAPGKTLGRRVLRGGLGEATTEGMQSFVPNVLAQEREPERPLYQGVLPSMMGGKVSGATLAAATHGMEALGRVEGPPSEGISFGQSAPEIQQVPFDRPDAGAFGQPTPAFFSPMGQPPPRAPMGALSGEAAPQQMFTPGMFQQEPAPEQVVEPTPAEPAMPEQLAEQVEAPSQLVPPTEGDIPDVIAQSDSESVTPEEFAEYLALGRVVESDPEGVSPVDYMPLVNSGLAVEIGDTVALNVAGRNRFAELKAKVTASGLTPEEPREGTERLSFTKDVTNVRGNRWDARGDESVSINGVGELAMSPGVTEAVEYFMQPNAPLSALRRVVGGAYHAAESRERGYPNTGYVELANQASKNFTKVSPLRVLKYAVESLMVDPAVADAIRSGKLATPVAGQTNFREWLEEAAKLSKSFEHQAFQKMEGVGNEMLALGIQPIIRMPKTKGVTSATNKAYRADTYTSSGQSLYIYPATNNPKDDKVLGSAIKVRVGDHLSGAVAGNTKNVAYEVATDEVPDAQGGVAANAGLSNQAASALLAYGRAATLMQSTAPVSKQNASMFYQELDDAADELIRSMVKKTTVIDPVTRKMSFKTEPVEMSPEILADSIVDAVIGLMTVDEMEPHPGAPTETAIRALGLGLFKTVSAKLGVDTPDEATSDAATFVESAIERWKKSFLESQVRMALRSSNSALPPEVPQPIADGSQFESTAFDVNAEPDRYSGVLLSAEEQASLYEALHKHAGIDPKRRINLFYGTEEGLRRDPMLRALMEEEGVEQTVLHAGDGVTFWSREHGPVVALRLRESAPLEDIISVFFHENLGHSIFRAAVGEERFREILNKIIKAYPDDYMMHRSALRARYLKELNRVPTEDETAEEYLAYFIGDIAANLARKNPEFWKASGPIRFESVSAEHKSILDVLNELLSAVINYLSDMLSYTAQITNSKGLAMAASEMEVMSHSRLVSIINDVLRANYYNPTASLNRVAANKGARLAVRWDMRASALQNFIAANQDGQRGVPDVATAKAFKQKILEGRSAYEKLDPVTKKKVRVPPSYTDRELKWSNLVTWLDNLAYRAIPLEHWPNDKRDLYNQLDTEAKQIEMLSQPFPQDARFPKSVIIGYLEQSGAYKDVFAHRGSYEFESGSAKEARRLKEIRDESRESLNRVADMFDSMIRYVDDFQSQDSFKNVEGHGAVFVRPVSGSPGDFHVYGTRPVGVAYDVNEYMAKHVYNNRRELPWYYPGFGVPEVTPENHDLMASGIVYDEENNEQRANEEAAARERAIVARMEEIKKDVKSVEYFTANILTNEQRTSFGARLRAIVGDNPTAEQAARLMQDQAVVALNNEFMQLYEAYTNSPEFEASLRAQAEERVNRLSPNSSLPRGFTVPTAHIKVTPLSIDEDSEVRWSVTRLPTYPAEWAWVDSDVWTTEGRMMPNDVVHRFAEDLWMHTRGKNLNRAIGVKEEDFAKELGKYKRAQFSRTSFAGYVYNSLASAYTERQSWFDSTVTMVLTDSLQPIMERLIDLDDSGAPVERVVEFIREIAPKLEELKASQAVTALGYASPGPEERELLTKAEIESEKAPYYARKGALLPPWASVKRPQYAGTQQPGDIAQPEERLLFVKYPASRKISGFHGHYDVNSFNRQEGELVAWLRSFMFQTLDGTWAPIFDEAQSDLYQRARDRGALTDEDLEEKKAKLMRKLEAETAAAGLPDMEGLHYEQAMRYVKNLEKFNQSPESVKQFYKELLDKSALSYILRAVFISSTHSNELNVIGLRNGEEGDKVRDLVNKMRDVVRSLHHVTSADAGLPAVVEQKAILDDSVAELTRFIEENPDAMKKLVEVARWKAANWLSNHFKDRVVDSEHLHNVARIMNPGVSGDHRAYMYYSAPMRVGYWRGYYNGQFGADTPIPVPPRESLTGSTEASSFASTMTSMANEASQVLRPLFVGLLDHAIDRADAVQRTARTVIGSIQHGEYANAILTAADVDMTPDEWKAKVEAALQDENVIRAHGVISNDIDAPKLLSDLASLLLNAAAAADETIAPAASKTKAAVDGYIDTVIKPWMAPSVSEIVRSCYNEDFSVYVGSNNELSPLAQHTRRVGRYSIPGYPVPESRNNAPNLASIGDTSTAIAARQLALDVGPEERFGITEIRDGLIKTARYESQLRPIRQELADLNKLISTKELPFFEDWETALFKWWLTDMVASGEKEWFHVPPALKAMKSSGAMGFASHAFVTDLGMVNRDRLGSKIIEPNEAAELNKRYKELNRERRRLFAVNASTLSPERSKALQKKLAEVARELKSIEGKRKAFARRARMFLIYSPTNGGYTQVSTLQRLPSVLGDEAAKLVMDRVARGSKSVLVVAGTDNKGRIDNEKLKHNISVYKREIAGGNHLKVVATAHLGQSAVSRNQVLKTELASKYGERVLSDDFPVAVTKKRLVMPVTVAADYSVRIQGMNFALNKTAAGLRENYINRQREIDKFYSQFPGAEKVRRLIFAQEDAVLMHDEYPTVDEVKKLFRVVKPEGDNSYFVLFRMPASPQKHGLRGSLISTAAGVQYNGNANRYNENGVNDDSGEYVLLATYDKEKGANKHVNNGAKIISEGGELPNRNFEEFGIRALTGWNVPESVQKAVTENGGIYLLSQGSTIPPDVEAIRRKMLGKPPELIQTQWKRLKSGIRRNLAQSIFDKFYSIKEMSLKIGVSLDAYMMARLTTTIESTIDAMMQFGPPVWRDKVVAVNTNYPGLNAIFNRLGSNPEMLHMWAGYMVGLRAKELKQDGRENLFTDEDIERLIALGDEYPVFQEVRRSYNDYRAEFLKFIEEAGLINEETRALWEQMDYIPFYRVVEDEGILAVATGRGLANQKRVYRRLKGGKAALADPIENIMRNFIVLTDMAMKNMAAQEVVQNFLGTGLIMEHPAPPIIISMADTQSAVEASGIDWNMLTAAQKSAFQTMYSAMKPAGNNVIMVMRNGQRKHYYVQDAGLFRSMTSINTKPMEGLFMSVARGSKRLLTAGVTLAPGFPIVNWMRDTLSSFVVGRDATVPVLDGLKGAAASFVKDETAVKMMASGANFSTGYINAGDPSSVKYIIEKNMRDQDFRNSILDTPLKMFDVYIRMSGAAENAHRHAVYHAARKKGKSELEALYEAKDLMDFSMRGESAIIGFLCDTIPFFGARLQGLYRIGRGAAHDPAAFAVKGLLLTLASVALFMRYRDDERYKRLEEFDKDMYYHFWVGKDHYRIPKPFEVGAIFSTIPERAIEATFKDLEKRDPQAASIAAIRMFAMLRDTFNLLDYPQVMKPVVEVLANKDSFTGRPIVPMRLERLPPEMMTTENTSLVARSISKVLPGFLPDVAQSPAGVDHLIAGYTGTLGEYAVFMADRMLKNMENYPMPPTLRPDERPIIGRLYRGEDFAPKNSKYATAFYDALNEATKVHNALVQYGKVNDHRAISDMLRGDRFWWEGFQSVNGAQWERAYKAMQPAVKEVRKINAAIRDVQRSLLPPEMKRKELDILFEHRYRIFRAMYEVRPGGALNQKRTSPPLNQQVVGSNEDVVERFMFEDKPAAASLFRSVGTTQRPDRLATWARIATQNKQ